MSARQVGSNTDAGVGGGLALKDAYRLVKREVESSSLQSIEPDTYQKIAAAVGSMHGQGFEGVEAKLRDRLVELLADTARLLIEARLYKMRSGRELIDYSKLTDEEKYALDGMADSAARVDEVISATTKGRVKVLESISIKIRSKRILVRILKPVEAFVGVDMNKYGPFQQEDVASLPLENARSMVESGQAVAIHGTT